MFRTPDWHAVRAPFMCLGSGQVGKAPGHHATMLEDRVWKSRHTVFKSINFSVWMGKYRYDHNSGVADNPVELRNVL